MQTPFKKIVGAQQRVNFSGVKAASREVNHSFTPVSRIRLSGTATAHPISLHGVDRDSTLN